MGKISLSKEDYVEKNCKDCVCKSKCDLYKMIRVINVELKNVTMQGDSDMCSFKNVRGVNLESIDNIEW